MSSLPQVRPKDLLKTLQKIGFQKIRQTGSHVYLKHSDGRLTSISVHPGTIPPGTLKAILRQTKIDVEKLKEII